MNTKSGKGAFDVLGEGDSGAAESDAIVREGFARRACRCRQRAIANSVRGVCDVAKASEGEHDGDEERVLVAVQRDVETRFRST